MSVNATEAIGGYAGAVFGAPAASATSGQPITSTSTSNDKDMFLQLLVAQMKYQDPMNPTDSSQFLAQSAQFTALEKMQAVADQTAAMVSAQMAFGASSLVGRTVTWTPADGVPQTGTVSGVTFGADGPTLDVGGTTVPLAQLSGVTAGSDPTGTGTAGA